ncbi:MAG: copper resistance D family protein [Actinomycetota bacterium]
MITLPQDLVAFILVLARGAQLSAQSLALGGLLFLLGVMPLFMGRLGTAEAGLIATGRRWTAWSGLGVAATAGLTALLSLWALIEGLGLNAGDAAGAEFLAWNLVAVAGGIGVAVVARGGKAAALVASSAVVVLGALMSSHAAARVDDRAFFLVADALHQLGAGLWIGGIPFLLLALVKIDEAELRRAVGLRFSTLFVGAVAALVVGMAMMVWGYIGSFGALIGTAYGIMGGAKMVFLLVLLGFALANKLSLKDKTFAGTMRLRRFAEVELGIGLTIMFVAASLASQPPGIDQAADQATWAEIYERIVPMPPRLESPTPDQLTQFGVAGAQQSELSEAMDRAWSEYNHNWAGIWVTLVGVLALLSRSGKARWAVHWPLVFLAMAAWLFVRADPESWPLGPIPFFEALKDPEVFQHRVVTFLIVPFGLFEWGVRTGRLKSQAAALVFPILCAVGGALLLIHNHTLSDVKVRFLIEFTHIPMGVVGLLAGWGRWLELRGDGRIKAIAGWVWPIMFIAVGLMLVDYREG